ncbi:MAG: putative Na+/H+ antiporter [Limnohabitans sp.]
MFSLQIEHIAALIFVLALLHTFSVSYFAALAKRSPQHAGVFHLLSEVEVVFGFWAFILVGTMAVLQGGSAALAYAESRQYTEPLFVFVVMVMAASRPVLLAVTKLVNAMASLVPLPTSLVRTWMGLAMVPLIGSLITEPAAMTLAALMLSPLVFHDQVPERLKYLTLGVLFVNVSIGGTLTSFAAPPVLMVASTWQWDSTWMLLNFGWKSAVAVVLNASLATCALKPYLQAEAMAIPKASINDVPWPLIFSHLSLLAGVVVLGHYPVAFLGLFLLFLGLTHAYPQHQNPLVLKEALLVAFFLAGLVVIGGMQQWWLQPLLTQLSPNTLFGSALGLTSITDNAALTYLGSLIEGLSDEAKYNLMAGAVAGGGLTVIANAPNPAGAALLKKGFQNASISALGLLGGALLPTLIAAMALRFLPQ